VAHVPLVPRSTDDLAPFAGFERLIVYCLYREVIQSSILAAGLMFARFRPKTSR